MLAELLEVVLAGFESVDRVAVGILPFEFGEAALFALVEFRGVLAELFEHGADRVGLGCRQVAESLLGGDDSGDLFEFDDVGPVGDDPVASCVLDGHGGGEVFVDLGGVEGGVDDPVDELSLISGCGIEQLLQLVLAVDQLGWGAGGGRHAGWGGVVGEPDPVFEQSDHQVLPPVGVGRVGGSGSDSCFGVGDVVEEAVMGDAGGGVVPH